MVQYPDIPDSVITMVTNHGDNRAIGIATVELTRRELAHRARAPDARGIS
jgi:hypothetical protein